MQSWTKITADQTKLYLNIYAHGLMKKRVILSNIIDKIQLSESEQK